MDYFPGDRAETFGGFQEKQIDLHLVPGFRIIEYGNQGSQLRVFKEIPQYRFTCPGFHAERVFVLGVHSEIF